MNKQGKKKGFTLLEVLAALAIVAIALVALFNSLTQSTRLTARVEERMVGNWVASNALTQFRVTSQWPKIGEHKEDVNMAGREWFVVHKVNETADEYIRRIEVQVSLDSKGSQPVASLYGYFFNPKPKLFVDE